MRATRFATRPSPFAKSITHVKPKPGSQPIEFKVGQKVVYPGHGVGQIVTIESKEIAGKSISFYMVRILESDVTVMVPLDKIDNVGLRPTATPEEVQKVYTMLKKKEIVVEQTTWNRRYREYMEKIKTGSIYEIAEVLRDLYRLKTDKDLSFGERKMLDTAKSLLVKELSLAQKIKEETIEEEIKEIFESPIEAVG
jgi:CarD family transcriptional regulator